MRRQLTGVVARMLGGGLIGSSALIKTSDQLLVAGFGMIGRSPMMTGSCCVGWCQWFCRVAG